MKTLDLRNLQTCVVGEGDVGAQSWLVDLGGNDIVECEVFGHGEVQLNWVLEDGTCVAGPAGCSWSCCDRVIGVKAVEFVAQRTFSYRLLLRRSDVVCDPTPASLVLAGPADPVMVSVREYLRKYTAWLGRQGVLDPDEQKELEEDIMSGDLEFEDDAEPVGSGELDPEDEAFEPAKAPPVPPEKVVEVLEPEKVEKVPAPPAE